MVMAIQALSSTIKCGMTFASVPCYRLVNHQRIDGRVYLRENDLFFEADFPSRNRLQLPFHMLLGYRSPSTSSGIELLSERGVITLYPIEERFTPIVEHINKHWSPKKLSIKDTQPEMDTHLQAYLEGGVSIDHRRYTECSVQVRNDTIEILRRNASTVVLSIACVDNPTVKTNPFTRLTVVSFNSILNGDPVSIRIQGSQGHRLWALIDCLSSNLIPHYIWSDKPNWWSHTAFVLLDHELRGYTSKALPLLYSDPLKISWDAIHTLDFGRSRLVIQHANGKTTLGRRHPTTFYKGVVERLLENICTSFESGTVGLWDDDRQVHIGRLHVQDSVLKFDPRNPKLAPLEYHLRDLWMPDLYDTSKAVIKLRIPTVNTRPEWLVIHFGSATVARHWASALNMPSSRVPWFALERADLVSLLHNRQGSLQLTSNQSIEVVMHIEAHGLAIRSQTTLPLEQPLEFWFDDGERRLRIETSISFKQDLPVQQWVLERPGQIDVFNHRAHHRTHVDLEVNIVPLKWDGSTGWCTLPKETNAAMIRDISISGCALDSTTPLPMASLYLLQIEELKSPMQILGVVKYQKENTSTGLVRTGFEFLSLRPTAVRKLIQETSNSNGPPEELGY